MFNVDFSKATQILCLTYTGRNCDYICSHYTRWGSFLLFMLQITGTITEIENLKPASSAWLVIKYDL